LCPILLIPLSLIIIVFHVQRVQCNTRTSLADRLPNIQAGGCHKYRNICMCSASDLWQKTEWSHSLYAVVLICCILKHSMNFDRTCITLICFLSVNLPIFIKSICNNCFFSCTGKNCFIVYKPNFDDAHSSCVNYIIFLLIIDIVIIHLCKNYFLFSHILCSVFFFCYFFVVIIVVILV